MLQQGIVIHEGCIYGFQDGWCNGSHWDNPSLAPKNPPQYHDHEMLTSDSYQHKSILSLNNLSKDVSLIYQHKGGYLYNDVTFDFIFFLFPKTIRGLSIILQGKGLLCEGYALDDHGTIISIREKAFNLWLIMRRERDIFEVICTLLFETILEDIV